MQRLPYLLSDLVILVPHLCQWDQANLQYPTVESRQKQKGRKSLKNMQMIFSEGRHALALIIIL